LKAGSVRSEEDVEAELVQMVREYIGAVASFRRVLVVRRLPKTRSGKTLRRVMRSIVAGEEYQMPSTIDDPAILTELEDAVRVLP
jgi:propionyl-CoA synthetase